MSFFSVNDNVAVTTVAYLFARRCHECGITEMIIDPVREDNFQDEPRVGWHFECSCLYFRFARMMTIIISFQLALFVDLVQQHGIKLEEKRTVEVRVSPGLDYDDEERLRDLHERQARVHNLGEDSRQMVRMSGTRKIPRHRVKFPAPPQNFDPKQDGY